MDRGSVLVKLDKALNTLGEAKVSVKFDSNDVVKIEIISNVFKNIIITKRIDMVLNAILDISMADLLDNNISIIALTENEVNLNLRENGNSNIIVSNGEYFAAQAL